MPYETCIPIGSKVYYGVYFYFIFLYDYSLYQFMAFQIHL